MESAKQQENYEHSLYKHCDEKEADAIAWAFVSKDKVERFPYKFSELLPDEIRANVIYSGLCLSDSLHGRNCWGFTSYPVATGHEIIAEVSELGKNVTDFKVGDKVAFGTQRDCCDTCYYCKNDKEKFCAGVTDKYTFMGQHWGGYSTNIQHPAKFFFKLPEGLDIKRAAPLLCAGITVWAPIKTHAKSGDKAAVIGIGGLGHLAILFLSKLGYNVTAFTTSSDKNELIKSLGASQVVNSKDENEFKSCFGKYNFIINTTPIAESLEKFIVIAAPEGKFIQIGAPHAGDVLQLPVLPMLMSDIQVIGSGVGNRHEVREMMEFCAKENIYPMCEEFSFEDFPKAIDRLENGKPKFRCVVNVEEFSRNNKFFK